MFDFCCFLSLQVDKLEEAESNRKTDDEVKEPQAMVFGKFQSKVHPFYPQK